MNNLVTNSDSESTIVGVLNAGKNSTSTCKVNITTRFDVKNHKLNTQYIAKGVFSSCLYGSLCALILCIRITWLGQPHNSITHMGIFGKKPLQVQQQTKQHMMQIV